MKTTFLVSKIGLMGRHFKFFFPLLGLFFSHSAAGQSVLSEYAENTNFPIEERLSSEKILRISQSKRIFLLSFENRGFFPGDFITLIYKGEHVARAIAAKTKDSKVGIKIVKIYSLPLWNELRTGLEVKILKGDDSYFINRKKEEKKEKDTSKIVSADDLFDNEVFLDEDLDEDKKRWPIKADNLIQASAGLIATVDLEGELAQDFHFNFSWGHQMDSGIWGELSYGRSTLSGFPDEQLTTILHTFAVRLKYTFAAPFHSFLLPYVGYQLSAVQAPEADLDLDTKTPEEQSELLQEIEKSGPILGITVLKRLVPGWFASASVGTEMVSVGMALEF